MHDGIAVYKLFIPNCYYNCITFLTLVFLLSTCFLYFINQLMDGLREGGRERGTDGRKDGGSVGRSDGRSIGRSICRLVGGRTDR